MYICTFERPETASAAASAAALYASATASCRLRCVSASAPAWAVLACRAAAASANIACFRRERSMASSPTAALINFASCNSAMWVFACTETQRRC